MHAWQVLLIERYSAVSPEFSMARSASIQRCKNCSGLSASSVGDEVGAEGAEVVGVGGSAVDDESSEQAVRTRAHARAASRRFTTSHLPSRADVVNDATEKSPTRKCRPPALWMA
jgi:hypothetical protein